MSVRQGVVNEATVAAMPAQEPLLGAREVAALLGVKPRTVTQWGYRNLLPEPDLVVNSNRIWKRVTVLRWAGDSGRLADPDLRVEYKTRFKVEPVPYREGGRIPEPPKRRRTTPLTDAEKPRKRGLIVEIPKTKAKAKPTAAAAKAAKAAATKKAPASTGRLRSSTDTPQPTPAPKRKPRPKATKT